MFERFTDRARKVLALANQNAQRYNHEDLRPVHILLGICQEGAGVGATVLKENGIDLAKLRRRVEADQKLGETLQMGKIPHNAEAKALVVAACEESKRLGHNYVGTEHILIGYCRTQPDEAKRLGLDIDKIIAETITLLGPPTPPEPKPLPSQFIAVDPSAIMFAIVPAPTVERIAVALERIATALEAKP